MSCLLCIYFDVFTWHTKFIYIYIYIYKHMYERLPARLSICLSVRLSIYLFICLFVYVSMYRDVYSSLLCLKFWRFLERLKFCNPKCHLYIWVQECVLSSFSKNGISVQTYRATVCFAWVPVQFSRRYSQGESYTKP